MLYEWKMAIRFLTDGKAQTLFILLGISVGVAVQVFLSSLIGGLQVDLVNSTIGTSPQITINPAKQSFQNDERAVYINNPVKEDRISDYIDIISGLDDIKEITAVSPSVQGNAFYNQGGASAPLFIKGIDMERADRIYNIKNRIIEGSSVIDATRLLIGKDFSEEYNLDSGDIINITMPDSQIQKFIVGGIFDLENQNLNSGWAFADISRAQRIYDLGGYISNIELQVRDPFDADIVAANIESSYQDISADNWKDENAQLLSALTSQSSSSYTIQAFVLLAIALGISSVLAVSVVQKSKQIGILKAMGTTSSSASRIFLLQGAVLGLIGSLFGVVLGLGLTQLFLIGTESSGGRAFPLLIERRNIILVIIISTLAGTVSSLVPARKSSKLSPMEVIRNG